MAKKHTIPSAKFGFSEIEGEDENEGTVWLNIGPVDKDGTVSEELAVIVIPNAAENEKKYPGLMAQRRRRAQIIAEALTEHADEHGLGTGFYFL